jgi:hypothetical protein
VERRRMELKRADRGQTIRVVIRMLGKLKAADTTQRDAQLRELHSNIAHELTACELGLGAQEMCEDTSNYTWTPLGPPSLLMIKGTTTIDAAIFGLKRAGADRAEVVKLRGTGHKGDPMTMNLRLPGMKPGKTMSMLIGTAAPKDKRPGAKATASMMGGHVCEGGWAMKHPDGMACRGILAAKVRRDGSKEVQEVCQAIDEHEKARVGRVNACPFYALYTAEKGVQAFCDDGSNRKGGGCWQKSASCGWDRAGMIPPDVEELRAKLLAAQAPELERTEVTVAHAKNPAKRAVAAVQAVESPGAKPLTPRLSKCYYCAKYSKGATDDPGWACEKCEEEIDKKAEAAEDTAAAEAGEIKAGTGKVRRAST